MIGSPLKDQRPSTASRLGAGWIACLLAGLLGIADAASGQGSVAAINARPADLAPVGITATGAGVKVGVIDTTPDLGHPTFTGLTAAAVDFSGVGLGMAGDHGTQTSSVIAGQGTPTGVAPGIQQLFVGNVFGGNPTDAEFWERVAQAIHNQAVLADVDVINISLGTSAFPTDGDSAITRYIDFIARTENVVFTKSAGNRGRRGSTTITVPGDAYNILTVGATTATFNQVAPFSSEGRTADLRNKPDIVAPGTSIPMAHAFWEDNDGINGTLNDADGDGAVGLNKVSFDNVFNANINFFNGNPGGGGVAVTSLSIPDTNADGRITGADLVLAGPNQNFNDNDNSGTISNGDDLFSAAAFDAGDDPDPDTITASGTSFAAPHVAGGSALLLDFAKKSAKHSTDHKVTKAILLNSADHTVTQKAASGGNAWNPSLSGIDSLDDQLGAGQLDVANAFRNFKVDPITDPTSVDPIAWDLDTIGANQTLDYMINEQLLSGTTLAATLVWDRIITMTGAGDPDEILDNTFTETVLANLQMELLRVDGVPLPFQDPLGRAVESKSPVDPTEHIFYQLPATEDYLVRITNTSAMDVQFGFALFSTPIPEPTTLILLIVGWAGAARRRRSA